MIVSESLDKKINAAKNGVKNSSNNSKQLSIRLNVSIDMYEKEGQEISYPELLKEKKKVCLLVIICFYFNQELTYIFYLNKSFILSKFF